MAENRRDTDKDMIQSESVRDEVIRYLMAEHDLTLADATAEVNSWAEST